jgi:hypothetical protein
MPHSSAPCKGDGLLAPLPVAAMLVPSDAEVVLASPAALPVAAL